MDNASAHDNITDAYRDPLDSFTDREQMLTLFEQLLTSAQPGKTRFLAVKGNSGTGKTFLIEYLCRRVCPSRGWQTGQLTFAQATPDFRSILKDLEVALKGCVPSESLKQYRTNRDAYNKSFDDYRNAVTINQAVEVKENSMAHNITQNTQVIIQLRERERQLRSELSHALLELAEECQRPLCLFIDGYERLAESDPKIVGWLWESVLLKLATSSPQPFLVMTCGWEWPVNAAIKTFMQREALDDFDLMRVSHYLYKQGVISPDAASTEQEELITTFHDLSNGHPLVLSLAATYFHELNAQERTAASLRTKQSLIDDKARIEFLDERLLSRLPEPYRTLLERGPILRSLDQRTLQELLQVGIKDATSANKLDDRTYEYFLHYPFINIQTVSGDSLLIEPTFHDLVRRVRLDTLRRLHPETKKQLHRRMVDYYERMVGTERKQELIYLAGTVNAYTRSKYIESLVEIPEKEFMALLEYFYHALQVEELRVNALKDWQMLTRSMLHSWRRDQTRSLLEVTRQLREEGESFLGKTSDSYGHYLILHARFLEQQARWDEAQTALEEAAHLFEQVDNLFDSARCLNNIGHLYNSQGKLEEALGYYERALVFLECVGNPTGIATSLNNIGEIYRQQGKAQEALLFFERALKLDEQVGNPAALVFSLNNLGEIYRQQGKAQEALLFFERALKLSEQIGNPSAIATSLNNVGHIYDSFGKLQGALRYYERALKLDVQVGDPAAIASSLNSIGGIYQQQGKLEEALSHFKRALALHEQMGNPATIAALLNNIGEMYRQQGKLEEASSYFERALPLSEQVGNPAMITASLNNMGEIYRQQGKLEEALSYHKRALTLRQPEDDPLDIALSLNNIGTVYHNQGKEEEALSYFKRALVLQERIGKPADIATVLNNIGFIYSSQGNIEQALGHYERALSLFEQVSNPVGIASSLNNIGLIYSSSGKLEEALSYFKRALALRKQLGNPADVALSLHNIAGIYYKQKLWEQANTHYAQSLHLYEGLGRDFELEVASELEGLALCQYRLGQIEVARRYYIRAQQIRKDKQKN